MTRLPAIYELNLASSGKLKLRATARLAEGGADARFEASVLLHDAARLERLALGALPTADATTRLVSLVEECFCLVEGFDPVGAGKVWGRILNEKAVLPPASADALLARLSPRHEQSHREFATLVVSQKTLTKGSAAGVLVPSSVADQKSALREVRTVLKRFPGVASYWWAAYRLTEALADVESAWESLGNARKLEPENMRFMAVSLLLSTRALSTNEADDHLGQVRASLEHSGAEVCLMYALAELRLARAPRAHERWVRAKAATAVGLAQVRSESVRKNLVAIQFLVDHLLAGTKPTLDVLYLAGLGDEAASALPHADVLDLMVSMASRMSNMDSKDALAA